eukprot:5256583-Karenia_brevis.AAC.1
MPSPRASDAFVEPKGSPCSAPRSTSNALPAGSCTTAGSRWAHSVHLWASGSVAPLMLVSGAIPSTQTYSEGR